MNYITLNAIKDIGTFYGNTATKYPNLWDYNLVCHTITQVINSMLSVAIQSLHGERRPLLKTMDNGNVAELYIKNKSGRRVWYFTAQPISSTVEETDNTTNILIDNAVYTANSSHRAFRRGTCNPSAPLSADDRSTQQRITESQLRRIIREFIKKVLNII